MAKHWRGCSLDGIPYAFASCGCLHTALEEQADRIEALQADLAAVEKDRDALMVAARTLYLAGKWELHDTDILLHEQAVMWQRLRDALGLPPGTATALKDKQP